MLVTPTLPILPPPPPVMPPVVVVVPSAPSAPTRVAVVGGGGASSAPARGGEGEREQPRSDGGKDVGEEGSGRAEVSTNVTMVAGGR